MWPPGGAGLPPLPLLKQLRDRHRRLCAPRTPYAHLSTLPDGPVGRDGRGLRVLRDSRAVDDAADGLRNCARTYRRRCHRQEYILVGLFDGRGRPTALGGYSRDGPGPSPWSLDHVAGPRNGCTPPEVRRTFEAFLDTIAEWERAPRVVREAATAADGSPSGHLHPRNDPAAAE